MSNALPKKTNFRSALRVCLAACGLTVLLLTAVYLLRGIWPFGTDNVAYVDTAQFYLPGYYKIWDVMHGASRNVNWFSGLAEGSGASLYDLTVPANWVFLFVSRDHILESLSLYLMVYMASIALLSGLVLSLRFPDLKPAVRVLLALLYTFSGFVLQYYSNFTWLWVAAVFPLMLFALERLLRDGRYLLYAVLYAYYLYYSVYFTYMVTLYILLFSLGYCVFLLPKDLRGDRIFRLGASTAAAYGVTACFWMKSSSSLVSTSRFQSNLDSGLMTGLTTWDLTNTRHTFLMLLGMAAVAALLIRGIRRRKLYSGPEADRRRSVFRFFAFLLGMFALPMVFTNIDTAWHFGQYNFFPMRYGYMLPATLLAGAALLMQEEAALPRPADRPKLFWLWLLPLPGLAFLLPELLEDFQEYGACFLPVLGAAGYARFFVILLLCGLLFTALYLLLFRLRNRRAAAILSAVVLLFQTGANAFGLLAPNDDHVYTNEYDPAYVETADDLHAWFSGQDISPLVRFKNADNSLNAGYPAIAGISALSSVNSSNSNLRLGVFRELGYTVNYFRILDTGGTVFSDMLLGVQYILSAGEPDESLYRPSGIVIDDIRLCTANYPGQIGLTFPAGALDDYLDQLTLPDRLNTLYRAFTGSKEALAFDPVSNIDAAGEGVRTYTVTCQLPRSAFLYLAADGVLMNIQAGGRTVSVPTYQNTANTVYPAAFNSNLLYLGCFEAGEITVTFTSASPLTAEDITLAALDQARIAGFYTAAGYDENAAVTAGDDRICLTLSAEAGQQLFLPVSYSSRWHCTVNGSTVTPSPVMGVLMSLPLEEGENTVTLTRSARSLSVRAGSVCSLVFLALVILWLLFDRVRLKKRPICLPRPVCTASLWVFGLVCGAMILLVYTLPLVLLITQGTIIGF